MTQLQLLVADSFRVHPEGRVLGAERHIDRFRRGITEMIAHHARPLIDDLWLSFDDFIDHSFDDIRQAGEGFPRLELWGSHRELQLRRSLRPLPPLSNEIQLRSLRMSAVSGLRHVRVKGPNIELHTALVERFGTEVLLLTDADDIIEGTRTALMWWSGGVLHAVAHRDRVDSTMEHHVRQVADTLGYRTAYGVMPITVLADHEVWAVNALHGIRVVTSINGHPTKSSNMDRLRRFRRGLVPV